MMFNGMIAGLSKIRVMLVLGFLGCFCGVSLFVVLSYRYFISIESGLLGLSQADNILNSILEVRRYEKNYFLYHQEPDFKEALRYFSTVETQLLTGKAEIADTLGIQAWSEFRDISWTYRRALSTVHDIRSNGGATPDGGEIMEDQVNTIRASGQDLITLAEDLARREREGIQGLLHRYRILFGIFFSVTILMGAVVVYLLEVKAVRPLHTIEEATRIVGQGEFSPIAGVHSKDEIGSLVQAFNRMVLQLEQNRQHMIQTEKLTALGTLTSGVAHELNNPLSNISSCCQILLEEVQDRLAGYHTELLASIEDQVIKARDIVRALLEFSREKEFELKPVDLREVILDTLKLIKGDVPAHVAVRVDVPDGIVLDLDKARIEQAFMNLIMNGIQAMASEGVLTIMASLDRNANGVTVEFVDTGVGIPPEVLPRVFDPFFTTKDVGRGTGLGLSVTYGIVEHHRGRIAVESELGKGTRVIVQLPARDRGE